MLNSYSAISDLVSHNAFVVHIAFWFGYQPKNRFWLKNPFQMENLVDRIWVVSLT